MRKETKLASLNLPAWNEKRNYKSKILVLYFAICSKHHTEFYFLCCTFHTMYGGWRHFNNGILQRYIWTMPSEREQIASHVHKLNSRSFQILPDIFFLSTVHRSYMESFRTTPIASKKTFNFMIMLNVVVCAQQFCFAMFLCLMVFFFFFLRFYYVAAS